MRIYTMEDKVVLQVEQVTILTADVKQMLCKEITVHLESDKEIDINRTHALLKEQMHRMGRIYFSRDLIHARTSYSGAVRLAMNKELNKQDINCTRLHITGAEFIT